MFAVTSTALQRQLIKYFSTCVGCLRTLEKDFDIQLGKPLASFNHANFFKNISADILGKLRCKISSGVKRHIEVVPIAIICLDTLCVTIIPAFEMTRKALQECFQHLMMRTGNKIDHLVTDAGSQFTKIQEFLPGISIQTAETRAQSRNRVERSIKVVKSVLR